MNPISKLKWHYAIILLCFTLFSSCKLQLLPPYSRELAAQIDATAKEVDRFYLTMLDKGGNGNEGRAYPLFADGYINIGVELNSIYRKNRIRPKNEASTKISENALPTWEKYKAEHKQKNGLTDGVIQLNRKYMSDLFYTMLAAEEGKQ